MRLQSLPIDEIRIASPCTARWEDMSGDSKSRFCDQCQLKVYNLSQMSRPEIERLFENKEGRLCVRFYRRADGTMLTQDCPVGFKRTMERARQRLGILSAACASLLAGVLSIAGCKPAPTSSNSTGKASGGNPECLMGKPQIHSTATNQPPPQALMGEAIAPEVEQRLKQQATPQKEESANSHTLEMGDVAPPKK